MDFGWMFFSTDGRIGRREYWLYGILFQAVAYLLLGALIALASSDAAANTIYIVGALALFWPGIAVQAKRWHDRGKSGWWTLINFVPFVGGLWALLELGFLSGQPESNQYGEPYREVEAVLDVA